MCNDMTIFLRPNLKKTYKLNKIGDNGGFSRYKIYGHEDIEIHEDKNTKVIFFKYSLEKNIPQEMEQFVTRVCLDFYFITGNTKHPEGYYAFGHAVAYLAKNRKANSGHLCVESSNLPDCKALFKGVENRSVKCKEKFWTAIEEESEKKALKQDSLRLFIDNLSEGKYY